MVTKQYQIGQFTMGTTPNFNADADFDIPLDRLPAFLTPGLVAVVTGFELKLAGTFGTLANDPALLSYLLHGQLDTDVWGPTAFRQEHRHGWHDPLLSILQWGKVYGTRCLDLPATGAGGPGSYTRTFTKHIDFVEPSMRSKYARCMPAIAYAKTGSKLTVHPFGAARTVNGVHLSMSALTLTVTANIVEFPPNMVPLPVKCVTNSYEKNKDTEPSPDQGAYLRLGFVNDPRLATTGDDLSAYTTVDYFGYAGNYTVYQKTVEQLVRQFNEEMSKEQHQQTTGGTVKSEYRLLDPFENVDGKTRFIPFTYPKPGSDIAQIARWFGARPVAHLNNDVTTGLPASVDMLYQRVEPMDDAWKSAIVTALGDNALKRRLVVPVGYTASGKLKPGVDQLRVALQIDAS